MHSDAFAIQPGVFNLNFEIAAATLKALANRVGTEKVRLRLGITAKDEHDPLFAGQMMAAINTLAAYDRRYCIEHPLDTLRDAVDSLAMQIDGR
jgi:hypothetical protein